MADIAHISGLIAAEVIVNLPPLMLVCCCCILRLGCHNVFEIQITIAYCIRPVLYVEFQSRRMQ